MRTTRRTPTAIQAGKYGLVAGLVGTTCMTALQEVMARRRSASSSTATMEEPDPWSHAPAPAQLAKRLMEDLTGREVAPDRIPLYTNAVHWGYGIWLGAAYGVARRWLRSPAAVQGPAFGLGVWAWSYATLVPAGLYEWPWHYRPAVIAKDISYHLVYGAGTAAGYELVAGRR